MERKSPKITKSTPRPLGASQDLQLITEKRGRPAKYTPEVPDLAYRMFRLGFTIAQVAQNLGVSSITLESWMNNRREVREAYDKGRWESLLVIEESLYRRAKGYEYEETKEYSGTDSLGRPWERTVTTLKRVEPDTTAIIFWTKNRNPERWRDVWHTGPGTNYTQVNVNNNTLNLESLSEEDRELVARVSMTRIIEENDVIGEVE